MLKIINKFFFGPIALGFIAIVLMHLVSMGLRQPDFKRVSGAQNLEATYHALLTVNALEQNPLSDHWLLPTVTLGGENDSHIPWGATLPTKTGDYIYTSFTSPMFVAPYAVFKIINAQPSVNNLFRFNVALGAISSSILFFLLWRLMSYRGYPPLVAVGGAIVGCTVGIFSREALLSYGIVYWAQSLYQVIFAANILFVFNYLTEKPNTARQSLYSKIILFLVFSGAMTEWSGYIYNIGLFIVLWFGLRDVSSKKFAVNVFLATVAAGFLTVIHYGLVVGFSAAVSAFFGRFFARNTASGNFIELIQGYGLSYGMFLIVLAVLLSCAYILDTSNQQPATSNQQPATSNQQPDKLLSLIFIVASFPLIENFVMLQHATQFSYDRLKFIFPAALVLSFAFCRLSRKWRSLLIISVMLSCVHGYKSYKADMDKYSEWAEIDISNKKLSSNISERTSLKCAVISSNLGVRGYANLLLNKGIYEYKSFVDSLALMKSRGGCASVYLEGKWVFPDLPKYSRATITYNDGTSMVIDSEIK